MGNIIIWDVTRRIALHKLLGHEGLVHEVRFLDASRLISLGVDGVRLWDLVAAEALRELRHPQAPQGRFIYDLSLSGDGRRVCSTNFRGELEVTSLPVGDVLFASRVPTIFRIPKHLCTRSSSDSAWFGVGEGVLSVFHAETGARAWAPPTDEFIGGFAFDSARSRVVAVGEEHLLAFDLRDGKQTILATHERPTRSCRLDLASSGLRVVVSAGHVLTAHDAVSGKRLWRYESPDESPVLDIVWSPDGGTVALTSSDGVIRLLDGEAGTLRRELRGHQTSVFALAFSPDGRRLASGARDGTVRFWDPASGLTTLVLRAHSDYVHALAFDPTGDTLLSGSGDGTVRTWSIRPLSTRVAQRVAELAARARLLPLVQARLQAVGPEQAWGSLEQALPPADHDLARDVLLLESAKAEPK
jgi:WD40 repeat protein